MAHLVGLQTLPVLKSLCPCRRIETHRHERRPPIMLLRRRAKARPGRSTGRLTLYGKVLVALTRGARLSTHRTIKVRLAPRACRTRQRSIRACLAREAHLTPHHSIKVRLTPGACATRQPRTRMRLAGRARPCDRNRARLIHRLAVNCRSGFSTVLQLNP